MDDLLDLDWKATPASASASNNGQGRAAGVGGASGKGSYNFDALTRSLHSASPSAGKASGTSSPAMSSALRSGSPMLNSASMSRNPSSQPPAAQSSAGSGDVFSSLLSFGSSPSQSSGPMSLAEKQKRAQEEAHRIAQEEKRQQEARWGSGGADWDSLGATNPMAKQAATVQPVKQQTKPANAAASNNLWDFDSFTPGPSSSKAPALQARTTPVAQKTQKADDDFDWDSLEDLGAAKPATLEEPDDTDEVLGALGLPTRAGSSHETTPRARNGLLNLDDGVGGLSNRPARIQKQQTETPTGKRAVSPPPHVVGRIVEMGFSVQQARQALAKTESGLDVEAALESLLGGIVDPQGSRSDLDGWGPGGPPSRSRLEHEDREFARRLQDEEEEGSVLGGRRPPNERISNQRVDRARNDHARPLSSQGNQSGNGRSSPAHGMQRDNSQEVLPDWQKQADQIYTQAAELGTQVFSKANAFWASAKAQAAKALEERNTASENGSGRSSPATGSERARARRWGVGGAPIKDWSGKPKWMQDAEAAAAADQQLTGKEHEAGGVTESKMAGFKDSDDEDAAPSSYKQPAVSSHQRHAVTMPAKQRQSDNTGDLWDLPADQSGTQAQAPQPARRTGPARQRAAASAGPSAPLKERDVVTDDPGSVAAALRHKLAGNDSFKKGSYGEAEVAYSLGLQALATSSLRRVPLLNNRATTRLKNGDSAAAVADCTEVLTLIVPDAAVYRPRTEAPLPPALAAEVNLRDGWSKALLRRAQSFEAAERWKEAARDWNALEAFEKDEGSGRTGVQNMRSAQEGLARCGKMLSSGPALNGSATSASAACSKAAPTPVSRKVAAAVASAGEAAAEAGRARVRAEAAAQSAEDAAKFALKDQVDGRVDAWKKGKESNVRALVASIETVVWPELGWKKVGMHELVTDGQVKKNYMKAVGKLHPDKISSTNTTLENRMIAASVFAVLNEAWLNSKA